MYNRIYVLKRPKIKARMCIGRKLRGLLPVGAGLVYLALGFVPSVIFHDVTATNTCTAGLYALCGQRSSRAACASTQSD